MGRVSDSATAVIPTSPAVCRLSVGKKRAVERDLNRETTLRAKNKAATPPSAAANMLLLPDMPSINGLREDLASQPSSPVRVVRLFRSLSSPPSSRSLRNISKNKKGDACAATRPGSNLRLGGQGHLLLGSCLVLSVSSRRRLRTQHACSRWAAQSTSERRGLPSIIHGWRAHPTSQPIPPGLYQYADPQVKWAAAVSHPQVGDTM